MTYPSDDPFATLLGRRLLQQTSENGTSGSIDVVSAGGAAAAASAVTHGSSNFLLV